MVVAVLGKHLQIEFEDPFFLKHEHRHVTCILAISLHAWVPCLDLPVILVLNKILRNLSTVRIIILMH